jgi:hypothetical protein
VKVDADVAMAARRRFPLQRNVSASTPRKMLYSKQVENVWDAMQYFTATRQ